MSGTKISVIGGTGFVGRYLVHDLAAKGAIVRVISRNPVRGRGLVSSGAVGQITLEKGSILNRDDMVRAVKGADIVINLTGIMSERGSQKFAAVHAQGAEKLAKAAREAGADRFIHMSALGVEKAVHSKYARTKISGEQAVRAAFPNATIVRPSAIFGPEDGFLNMFAAIASLSPVVPLIGSGKTIMRPVYVGDVARAITKIAFDDSSSGKIYEFGGGVDYSLRQIIEFVMSVIGRDRILVPLPFSLAGVIAVMAELMPKPLLTYDQVQMLKYDNVPDGSRPGLAALGILPTAMEIEAPEYLYRYRSGNVFGHRA